MELYIDTANLSHIRECASYGFISGVTTNPSLLAKEDPKKDVKDIIKEIYASSSDLKAYLSDQFQDFLTNELFIESLSGHLLPDKASQARLPILLERIKEIADMA